MGRQRETGSVLPLTETGSSSSYSTRFLVPRYVPSATTIPPTGAISWRRAAVFTTTPATIPSPTASALSATTVSPVVMPMRTARSSPGASSFISSMARSMANAHRTARSGSSSWTMGAPNTATTASPMNFSTVPPWRSMARRSRVKYELRVARTSSGSERSERVVKPTRSQKSTVTTLRSSPRVGAASRSRVPQARQNKAMARLPWPQFGQAGIGEVYVPGLAANRAGAQALTGFLQGAYRPDVVRPRGGDWDGRRPDGRGQEEADRVPPGAGGGSGNRARIRSGCERTSFSRGQVAIRSRPGQGPHRQKRGSGREIHESGLHSDEGVDQGPRILRSRLATAGIDHG